MESVADVMCPDLKIKFLKPDYSQEMEEIGTSVIIVKLLISNFML